MVPVNPFNLKEINRKKKPMYSHTLPLCFSFVKGGGSKRDRRRLRKKLWERGWLSITLYYLTNNTKHAKAHDKTD